MIFCERLRLLRDFRNLSQQQVADAVKVNQTTISAWELGKKYPDFFSIKALSNFFEVSSDYLLGIDDE